MAMSPFPARALLSTVTYNTARDAQTYIYGNTSFPAALTGITDENGHRYATWTYDSTGRRRPASLRAGSISPPSPMTMRPATAWCTGPLGIVETYKFSTLQGVPKVTEIDRAANGTVAFASRGFSYDSNGFSKPPPTGTATRPAYTNNSHGLPTQIVYASGIAVSHTTSITYDTTWARLAHVITTPGLTTTLNYSSRQRHAADPRAGRHDQHQRSLFDQRPDAHLDL